MHTLIAMPWRMAPPFQGAVHLVDEGVDTGQILAQREVPVLPDDDEHTLSERIKAIEHVLYPQVIDAFTTGKINVD